MIPPDGIISEVYHVQKWRKDVDRHVLSPMYDAGDCHYFIDELAHLKISNFIIPVQWLEDNDGSVFADAYAVTFDNQVRGFRFPRGVTQLICAYKWQCIANVVDDNPILIKASDLQDNFLDMMDLNLIPIWNSECISLSLL